MGCERLTRRGAIMPLLAVDPTVELYTAIDVSELLPSRTIVLYWHRDRVHGSALDAFAAATRTVWAGRRALAKGGLVV